jgi:hypothetical protein
MASSATTRLSFSFRDDPGFLLLDDVVVTPAAAQVSEPTTFALAGLAIAGLMATRRRRSSPAQVADPAVRFVGLFQFVL